MYLTLEVVRKAKRGEVKTPRLKKKKELSGKGTTGVTTDPTKLGRINPRVKFEKYIPLKLEPGEVLDVAADHLEMKFPWS